MPTVKVWNDNVHPYKESFKGADIAIPAKGFIEMEYEEAIDFRGQFSGVAPEKADGSPDERFFKMIRVESPPPGSVYRDDGLINHMTGKRASSPEELRAMLAEFRDALVVDPEAEKAARSQQEDIQMLKAKIAALEAGTEEKRGPGRPRKEA